MYNLKSSVNFLTRIFNGSSTATDNIFKDLSRNFNINPIINGLSDHEAQLLKLENFIAYIQEFTSCYVTNINIFTVDEFQSKLSTESWVDIFEHISYLKIFLHLSQKVNLIPHTATTHR